LKDNFDDIFFPLIFCSSNPNQPQMSATANGKKGDILGLPLGGKCTCLYASVNLVDSCLICKQFGSKIFFFVSFNVIQMREISSKTPAIIPSFQNRGGRKDEN